MTLAWDFAAKARANADFGVDALRAFRGEEHTVGQGAAEFRLRLASRLVMEGVEAGLRALLLARGATPRREHRLAALYAQLDDAGRSLVDEAVRSALDRPAGGALPFGLPRVPSVLGGDASSTDHYASAPADVEACFFALDARWGCAQGPYLGPDADFLLHDAPCADVGLLTHGVLVCDGLANCFAREYHCAWE